MEIQVCSLDVFKAVKVLTVDTSAAVESTTLKLLGSIAAKA